MVGLTAGLYTSFCVVIMQCVNDQKVDFVHKTTFSMCISAD